MSNPWPLMTIASFLPGATSTSQDVLREVSEPALLFDRSGSDLTSKIVPCKALERSQLLPRVILDSSKYSVPVSVWATRPRGPMSPTSQKESPVLRHRCCSNHSHCRALARRSHQATGLGSRCNPPVPDVTLAAAEMQGDYEPTLTAKL